jgi:mRNA interferase MazF
VPQPNAPHSLPRRGEVWVVDFNPTRGAEIQKQRPAVVVSSDAVGRLPIKLVAPITGWKPAFISSHWHVRLIPDAVNGLTKESAVDVLQLRGVDIQRFIQPVGRLSPAIMEEIAAAIAAVIEYQ